MLGQQDLASSHPPLALVRSSVRSGWPGATISPRSSTLSAADLLLCILAPFCDFATYALSLLLIAGVGFAQIAFSATSNTTLQTVAPNHLRGRVMSVYMLVFAGSTPLGNLFTGGLAHCFGAPIALLIGAGLSIIAAVVGWIMRKPAERSLAESTRLAD